MTKAAFIERNGGFFPMDDDGREIVSAAKGKRIMLKAHIARNVRHHRLFFHLLQCVIEGGAWDGGLESLRSFIKIATHHVETVIDPKTGEVFYIVKSMNFESMDQVAFVRFFDRAVYVVCDMLLGGQDWEALRDEIIRTVDGGLTERAAA